MGANHSNSHLDALRADWNSGHFARKSAVHALNGSRRKKSKVKPFPPAQVTIATVTHNSVCLSWLPPRNDHGHPIIAYTIEMCRPKHGKRWQVLTKNCQSTSFEARHLESDTQYMFRVRAENIFGTGKPSAPSETVTTKVFEMSSDLNCYLSSPVSPSSLHPQQPNSDLINGDDTDGGLDHQTNNNNSSNNNNININRSGRSASTSHHPRGSQVYPAYQNLKRRHSFNVQLDGGVTSILNHSDVFLNTSFSSSTSTITNANRNNSSGNVVDPETKTLSLSRGQGYRSSLQPGRKVSLSAFLPGAKAQSMNRLRESRNSLRAASSDLNGNMTKTALLSRESLSSNSGKKELRNSLASSSSDAIGSLSSKEDNRRSRGSRCSLLSNQSDATVSNSHDGSRHSDYSSSMDNLDTSDFGDPIIGNSFQISMCSSLEDIIDQFSNTPTDKTVSGRYETVEEDDEISKINKELRNIELTDEKLRSQEMTSGKLPTSPDQQNQFRLQHNFNYYDSLEDPWEKPFSVNNNVSQDSFMVGPFCDDVKIAIYAKNLTDDVTKGFSSNENSEKGSHDFRTLRSVLQSDQTLVRPTRSIPEVVGVVLGETGEARTLTRGKLTTIEDADEEEDPVRVTTL